MIARRFSLTLLLSGLGALACGDDGPSLDAGLDGRVQLADASDGGDGSLPTDGGGEDAAPSPDAEPTDAGGAPGVIVVNEGGTALYHAPDGTLLAVRPTPSEFPLPNGGHITLILDRIYSFIDVPNLSRIEVRGAPPRSAETLQSLEIDVPASPDGKPITIWTGCSSASGAGLHIMPMSSECLAADDTAELWISAYDNGSGNYIHVRDIPVGNAGSAPRVVSLGGWTAFSGSPPEVQLSELRAGYQASLTTYTLRGLVPLYNLTSSFVLSSSTSGISSLPTVIPELGLEWRQSLAFEVTAAQSYDTWTRTVELRSLGHPLAITSSVSGNDLLPVASALELDAESGFIAWSFDGPLPASVDRIRIAFHEDASERVWEIWLPARRTELELPQIPTEFLSLLPNPNRVELRLEDRANIGQWTEVLDGWSGEINFNTSVWDWPDLGRVSSRWFVP